MKSKPFLTTTWSHLAMLNYEIDPAILRPFIPPGTELDTFEDKCFVSMVGFLYRDTRVLGISVPGYRDFAEVNLRYYVRYRAESEWRRGVTFIKEIVPRRAVAIVARKFYDENFVMHPMRYKIETPSVDASGPSTVEYSWRAGQDWQGLRLTTKSSAEIPAVGSEAEFITEHYWGYTARRDGTTSEYRVDHPQWCVQPALAASFDCDVAAIYGPEFVETLERKPSSSFLAEGSAVTVYRGRRLPLT